MDRAFYEEAVAIAERHVAKGSEHIASQRRIVAELKERGVDSTEAENALATFLTAQKQHEDDRRRLTNELINLGDSDAPGPKG